ncbi:S4 domain-containing protein, partial [Niallia sp.]|uniref:S4 domain-containing protein n=1 Tax=Niallia sp. TaxID=2837523 RepID=UPI00289AD33C
MEKKEHIIQSEQVNERIDKIVSTINSEWSRTQVQQWIKDGHVKVNGQTVKTKYKGVLNDVVAIEVPEAIELDVEAEEMDLDIYY